MVNCTKITFKVGASLNKQKNFSACTTFSKDGSYYLSNKTNLHICIAHIHN